MDTAYMSKRPHGYGSLKSVTIGFLLFFVAIILVLIVSDAQYLLGSGITMEGLWRIVSSETVVDAFMLSVATSACSLVLVVFFAVPMGYALSRFRFPGHSLLNTLVDVPLILPPVVIGISLLAFFATPAGLFLKRLLDSCGISLISGVGIVMGQFLVSVSYCVRAVKAAFDEVPREFEDVALTLGGSRWQVFFQVSIPLARNGLTAGAVMAWARAIGVFGPLMVFVGTGPRVQVMPTRIWLELSIGDIETSLTIALTMILIAGAALATVHKLAPDKDWM
jgi:molybdate transport system permease protein